MGPKMKSEDVQGISNVAFDEDHDTAVALVDAPANNEDSSTKETKERDTWGNPIEFLMSCISLSVGLGNIWRFPFTAYENGGALFVIVYVVVLLLIGKPLYFLEMILGQFSSSGSVKVWSVVPIAKGIGFGGAIATWLVVTYYCCLMALTVFYFFSSFQSILPWTTCDPALSDMMCYNSSGTDNHTELNMTQGISSAEQFFTKNVLKQLDNIDDGLGIPEWRLTLCLLFSWICVALILMKGVASSGKAAYFTALFPYVVLFILFVRGVTLPGAVNGLWLFFVPQGTWVEILTKLFSPKIWYAAVTQCFFSLSVGFGPIIMNSSYNRFRHTIYRDAFIVSLMDTFTSLLAGVTIFAILGNLALESGKDISNVVQSGGTGLAFISYPEAIAKFDVVPQLFAVLFFLMLFTLGVGSAVSLTGCVITIVCDAFPTWKRWIVTLTISCVGFLLGLVYITPGGQYVLDVVDFFGGGFVIYVMAVIQTIAICWIYGLRNFLRDVEFMLGIRLGVYWKFTWGFFIPLSLLAIFVYSFFNFNTFATVDGSPYPKALIAIGWLLAILALLQIPIWGIYAIYKQNGTSLLKRFKKSCKSADDWGPKDPTTRSQWILFKEESLCDASRLPQWMKNMLKIEENCVKRSGARNVSGSRSTISILQIPSESYSRVDA